MTRPLRVSLIAAGSIVLLLLIVVVAGLTVVRSQWFRDKVRDRIVAETEHATGGRVEIAAFDFDWKTLTATLRGFTIHGTEPGSGKPLLHADDIVVGLKIISILKRDVDVALLRVDKPDAFLLIDAAGKTNIPNPKTPSKSEKSGVETILDLAVQRFELNDGLAEIHGEGQTPKSESYSAKAANMRVLFTFDAGTPRYHGDLSLAPLELVYGSYKPLPANISATVAVEKNKLVLEKSKITSGDSEISLNGQLADFNAPVITAEYKAKLSLTQAGSILKLSSRQSGWVEATGSASYKSDKDYGVVAVIKAYDVNYSASGINLRNVRAQAKVEGGPETVTIDGLRLNALGGEVTAKAEIRNFDRFKVNGALRHFDIRQVAALATREKLPYNGSINGPLFAEGRFQDLKSNRFTATARLNITPAANSLPVNGLIDAKYNGARQTLDLGRSFIALPQTRLEFSGVLGSQLQIHLASSNLNDLLPALTSAAKPGEPPANIPVTLTPQGQVFFDGTVSGKLANPELAGHLGGENFNVQGQTIDALGLDVTARKNGVVVTNGSLRQKTVSAMFAGSVGLREWKPDNDQALSATLGLRNASLPDMLALAGRKGVAATGTLNVDAKVGGTVGAPQASADLNLIKGDLQGEPFDGLTAHLDAPNRTTQKLTAQLTAGSKRVNLNASYLHGGNDFLPGHLTFSVNSNDVALAQIVTLRQRQPDLSGNAKLTAEGTVDLQRDSAGKPTFTVSKINADATVASLELQGKRLGDLHLTANTVMTGGSAPVVEAKLRSNLADATLTADARVTLAGDYNTTAKLQLANANLDTLRRLVLTPEQLESIRLGGSIEASADLSGPLARPGQLKATLEIPKLELYPLPGSPGAGGPVDLTLKNSGPLRISLENNVIRVLSAHLVAQDSDFTLAGRLTLAPQEDANLRLNGNINLALVHLFNNDIVSSGSVVANASLRGSLQDPQFSGSLKLQNANLALVDVPNGLSKANGTILFNGTQATVESLTAESGGGKVSLGGFASLAGGALSFRLNADAAGVRVRYPQGVSTVADAQLNFVGSAQRSVLSGTVTIERLSFNPKTDLGSVLSSAPPETPSGSAGFASNTQLDVQIQTSPDITFQSSYTQSLEADANLRLRGTAANPALLGRINVTQGDLTFFGNKYTINQGSVSFFNPVKLEPILNIDLETVARGVDVTLTVSGPINKLNVSYRSDPPLQFSDIVGLLATGRTPNDATIAARQPTAPQQSWQQMGASALVGQAIANPVAGRLQRFFGVSKLKIDPTISGLTGNPQAKLTLEQQVTPDVTFTYITDVANQEGQVVRVEWAFSKDWSAVALRDSNGEFGIDFLYKKRFR